MRAGASRAWMFAYWLAVGFLIATPSHAADNRIFAAGSLRQALNDRVSAYQQGGGQRYVPTYGPSGKLRQEIEQGNAPKEADAFVGFATGPEGRRIFDHYGFK